MYIYIIYIYDIYMGNYICLYYIYDMISKLNHIYIYVYVYVYVYIQYMVPYTTPSC